MVLRQVNNCPSTFSKWRDSSKECPNTDYYHCVLNENSNFVQGCIKPIWIETGFCPVYNTKAVKMDSQKCKRKECPSKTFRSFQIYQYPECLLKEIPNLDTTLKIDIYSPTTQNSTTTGSSRSLESVLPAVLIPLFVLLFIAIVAIFYLKKKSITNNENNSKEQPEQETTESDTETTHIRRLMKNFNCFCKGKKAIQRQTEKNEDVEQEEKLLCADVPPSKGNDKPESFTREELPSCMNIEISEIAEETTLIYSFAVALWKNKSLALIGKWGSGKRTLATQIALQMENVVEEKLQFKVIHHFDEKCESSILKLSQPTVIILPDLYKFWCTDQHNKDVIDTLYHIRLKKKTNLYIIATFTENAWESFTYLLLNISADSLFPVRKSINLSSKTVSEIGEKNQLFLKKAELKEIMYVKSVLGKALITILYCKHLFYRNSQFLMNPLFFILSDLRRMRISSDERMKFRVLEYTMLHGGDVDKKKLENDIDHPLFDQIENVDDKREYIKGCFTQLLNGYIEEKQKTYRILHDVITKCVFLVAAEKEQELLLMECDYYLLFDCIRLKSRMEKMWKSGKFSFDEDSLSMGIPTESYSMVVNIFKKRNDIMPMLRKVKLFDDMVFQEAWNTIETQ